jgi:hypothetical protein
VRVVRATSGGKLVLRALGIALVRVGLVAGGSVGLGLLLSESRVRGLVGALWGLGLGLYFVRCDLRAWKGLGE